MKSWQMQPAKAQFPELVEHMNQEGPQDITRTGVPWPSWFHANCSTA